MREPEVYLLGRQVIDDTELDRFLKDHGISLQTDTEIAGEHLTEVAGRVCYIAPGHDQRALGRPEYAQLFNQAIAWAARRSEG